MNLWEDTHRRSHAGLIDAGAPEPPIHELWQTPTELAPHARSIDAHKVRARLEDTADAAPLPDDEDPEQSVVDERDYGNENRHEAHEAIKRSGIEAIAYYAPIHYWGRSKWGIYLHERLFFGACAEISASLGVEHWDGIVVDMLQALDLHELFHAALELFSLVLEDFAGLASLDVCPYEDYSRKEYQKTWPTVECLEESLATAHEFHCRYRTPGFRAALRHLDSTAPPAYASWPAYKNSDAFTNGVQALAKKVIETSYGRALAYRRIGTLANGGLGAFWFPELNPYWLDSKGPVPRWVYRTGSTTTRRFLRALLGNVRMQEFESALVRVYNGYIVNGGKHRAIEFPNGTKVPFGHHTTVPHYLIGAIAKALGITRKALLASCLGV